MAKQSHTLFGISIEEAAENLQKLQAQNEGLLNMVTARHSRRFGKIDRACSYCGAVRLDVSITDRCEGCGACDWVEEGLPLREPDTNLR